ncbi:FecR family protein [Dyadobacter chenhuakuii]|uniref:FecR domain-containing protein n=1 Tax=Dyadobacter chenhuakuii TaxID=2909339 RepID=A0ABY4XSF6_9BACT|nr:FecR family protein [Dyadobacter chenhuakuii]MCF2492355.1 FecR domain-containing protein [Dyadobacter chenhuakuii]USJ33342.1 FecR domain-containing protein [Dyadobacter chenhuakuii]
MIKDYTNFSVIDLAIDDAFLRHYLLPSPESDLFWYNWLRDNPGQATDWEEARKLVEAVLLGLKDYTRIYLSEEAEEELLQRIWATNRSAQPDREKVVPMVSWQHSRLLAACVVLAILAAGYWFVWQHDAAGSMYQKQVSQLQDTRIEKVNSLSQPQIFYLPDSSSVLLFPASKMSYSSAYNNENRNVYLSGKAIFDVRKNPERPFLVYANEIITKVLGTRFEVSAFEKDADVIVKVQSGQVSVYQEKEYSNSSGQHSEKAGVLLLPNQQVVFKRTGEQFNKALVESPALLPAAPVSAFVYDETPVLRVLEEIEMAYGVDIVFSDELLQSCELTANLSEEPLRGKLDIICRSIGATYEIVDAQIIITSKGCKEI